MPAFEFNGRKYNNPVELALFVIGGKWKMPILWRLKDGAMRYGELKRSLGRTTHKVLAEQLRELERDGLVARTVFPEVPPHVEYRITDLGLTVIPAIELLRKWGDEFRKGHAGE
jgi:DNA-binding HxlR family transcriptional regulator